MAVPIVFGITLLFFGRNALRKTAFDQRPVDRRFLILHVLAFVSLELFEIHFTHAALANRAVFSGALALGWFSLILLSTVTLCAALLPLHVLPKVSRRLGSAWLYAAICSVLAFFTREAGRLSWDSHSVFLLYLQSGAFEAVSSLLRLFYHDAFSLPALGVVGTPGFAVEIAGACSGIEGLTLITVLAIGWMISMRHELRIGRAMLLLPLALLFIWLLNIVRIAILLAIGIGGHPVIARTGFHSEAGWIVFNLVSLAFLLTAQNVPWFRKPGHLQGIEPDAVIHVSNPAAAYLLPFLAVIAASMVAQAGAGEFEWLYPLRLIAAVAALLYFRRAYAEVDWRFGWLGILGGIVIGILWIAAAHSPAGWHLGGGSLPADSEKLAKGLARLQPGSRALWLSCRVLAAVFTVPIVEELAFRGFVARRLISADFERVPYRLLTGAAILGSSALFGLVHGNMWVAGIVSGVIFAWVAHRRNRLGEAVAAHAVANLMLAIAALVWGEYGLW